MHADYNLKFLLWKFTILVTLACLQIINNYFATVRLFDYFVKSLHLLLSTYAHLLCGKSDVHIFSIAIGYLSRHVSIYVCVLLVFVIIYCHIANTLKENASVDSNFRNKMEIQIIIIFILHYLMVKLFRFWSSVYFSGQTKLCPSQQPRQIRSFLYSQKEK